MQISILLMIFEILRLFSFTGLAENHDLLQPYQNVESNHSRLLLAVQPGEEEALIFPDLVTLTPSDLDIINNTNGDRLLRLTNTVLNLGPGPLEVRAVSSEKTGSSEVYQHIYYEDMETTYERLAGEFIFHPGHDHWHIEDFVHYELWSITTWGKMSEKVANNDKVSYCLRDNASVPVDHPTTNRHYLYCENKVQGISVGWVDIYRYYYEGQSIEINELKTGSYILRSIVDPINNLQEVNDENNAALLYIYIENNTVRIIGSRDAFWEEIRILYKGVPHGQF